MSLTEKLRLEKIFRAQREQEAANSQLEIQRQQQKKQAETQYRMEHAEELWSGLAKEYLTQLGQINQFKQESRILELLKKAKEVLQPSNFSTELYFPEYFPNSPHPYIHYYCPIGGRVEEPVIKYEYNYLTMKDFLRIDNTERAKIIQKARQKPFRRLFSGKSSKTYINLEHINPLSPPEQINILEYTEFEWLRFKTNDDGPKHTNQVDIYIDSHGNILIKDSRGISYIPLEDSEGIGFSPLKPYEGSFGHSPQISQLQGWHSKPEIVDIKLGEAFNNPQQHERFITSLYSFPFGKS